MQDVVNIQIGTDRSRRCLPAIILTVMCASHAGHVASAQTVTTPPGSVPSDDESSGDEPLADICLVGASPDYTWRPRLIYEIGTTIPSSGVQRRRVFGDNDLHLGVSSDGTITVNASIRRERFEGDPMEWPIAELAHYHLESRRQMSDRPTLSPAPTRRELKIGEAINKRLYGPEWYEPGGWGYDWLGPGGYGYDLAAVFVAGAATPRVMPLARTRAIPRAQTSTVPEPIPHVVDNWPRIVNFTNPNVYYRVERVPGHGRFDLHFHSGGEVNQNGGLSIKLALRNPSGVRSSMRGRDEFANILRHFEGRFDHISCVWGSRNDNLATVNRLTRVAQLTGIEHRVPMEFVISQTWTYKQAARHGYTNIVIHHIEGAPGSYARIRVNFHKPDARNN